MTLAELLAPDAPPVVPFMVGAKALGYGRSGAYAAARAGTFPVKVIRLSPTKWVVPTAGLRHLLSAEANGNTPP